MRTFLRFAAVIVAVGATAIHGAETMTGFLDGTIDDEAGSHGYVVYVPEDYSPKKKWPVILFLHGSGERGTDNKKQTAVGIAPAIRKDPSCCPAIVILPQCESKDRIPVGAWAPTSPDGKRALAILDKVQAEYSTDDDRVYLTGLSMGGFGLYAIAADDPDRWAALVPICGGGKLSEAEKFARVPLWCFHSSDDPVVPVTLSRTMVEALKKAGGQPRYTEYTDSGHKSWEPAYEDPELWKWLFEQKRK